MRDLLVAGVFFIGCLYTIRMPYYGVLLWSWFGYMNPHRLAYGFAFSAPFAQMAAILLVGSTIIGKEKHKFPRNILVLLIIIFIVFTELTTLNAHFPEAAKSYFLRFIKMQFGIFATLLLIDDLKKLNQLMWVIVLSIGFYSVKGGVFTLMTGGSYIVWGPSGTFIEDNNSLAIAILMIIPMMFYLAHIDHRVWIKRGLYVASILSLFTVLGSQSRGAFLSIIAVGAFFWSKSQSKLISAIAIAVIAYFLFTFMPESWYQRMDTIETYQQDGSAMGRINAWHYAFNAANHNLLGMGFESWQLETFMMYAPNPTDVHAAHSIYFAVLGDHGWIGLAIYLAIYLITWIKLNRITKVTKNNPALGDMNFLSKMLQVSLIAYQVGGAFLSLSYFDLPWHIISMVILMDEFLKNGGVRLSMVQKPDRVSPYKRKIV